MQHHYVSALRNDCYFKEADTAVNICHHQATTTNKDNNFIVCNHNSDLGPNLDKLYLAKKHLASRIRKGDKISV